MIVYEEGLWRPLFSLKGSVLQKAARWAFPFAFLTAGISVLVRRVDGGWQPWFEEMEIADRLRDFSFILGFLIVFRSQQAYSRWWEGGTLLQQLRGEWFNAFSSLLAFSNPDPALHDEVLRFQHQLARMTSLLYANALQQVATMEDTAFELIDIQGFDLDSLEFILTAHDSCEVVLQWVQRLIVEASGKDIIKIAPPILSRVYNQLGNGIVNLNNARKIRQFPIPFPLAQMVAFMLVGHAFVTSVVIAFAVHAPFYAGCLSFIVILAFWCINYISLELEQPYGDDDNDLPLHQMMEDLNKSLCSLLNPIATSPPEFFYRPEYDSRLDKIKVDLKAYVNSLVSTGEGKRRSPPKTKQEKKAQVPESPLVAPVPPAVAALVPAEVERAFEGMCNEGSAVEGLCDDSQYKDSTQMLQAKMAEKMVQGPPLQWASPEEQHKLYTEPGLQGNQQAALAPQDLSSHVPPASQKDYLSIDLDAVNLETEPLASVSAAQPQVLGAAAETKSTQSLRRSEDVPSMLSGCMPFQSLAGSRRGGRVHGGSDL